MASDFLRTDSDEPDTTPPPQRRSIRFAGWTLYGLFAITAILVGASAGVLLVYSTNLPQVDDLEHYRPAAITELYDDQGRVIGSFALQRRIIDGYDDFPKVLRDAIISVEDKEFETHWGVNTWRVFGAIYRDVVSRRRAQGASTLTMQLARNLFLTPDRNLQRKIQETLIAIQIERRFTKDQIFTLYANQIFLGHGVYGFEAGSRYYFGKPAKELTLTEAAVLAGLPKSPSEYSPINNPALALRRRNLVLNAMLEDGKITAEQAIEARESPIVLHVESDPNAVAPHFVEEIRRYLEKKYGSDQVHQGGLKIYTTLNLDWQRAANQAVQAGLAAFEKRHPSAPKGKAQSALLAIDNATGDIKAMIGGRNFAESKFDRATQAKRQVGSSFKPYVYTAVIDGGATPDDIILDAPTTFQTASGPYTPHNFDGKFEGNITLRRALAQSRNIPALKLAERVGINTVIDYAHRFGITSNIPPFLPIALGAADITLMEQVAAFSTFPNDGVRVTPHYIRKVTDYDGRVLEEDFPEVKDVISAKTARTMTGMLREVVLHGTAASAAKMGYPLAGKTGTTNDYTDAWFIGFSPQLTCGVWVGFDEKKSLGNKETGAVAALPIWMNFMKTALAGKDAGQFPVEVADPVSTILKPAPVVDTPDVRPGDGEAH